MPIPQLSNRRNTPLPPQHWRQRQFKRRPNGGVYRWLKNKGPLKLAWLAVAALILIFLLTVLFFSLTLPSPNKLLERQVAESTKIYDREGKTIIYEIHGEQKRTLVPLETVPQAVRDATIAIEDKNFYQHGAFSFWAIARTAVSNVFRGQLAGGSTLTQQFVKNAVLTNEKKISRKIKELILSYRLEKKFSKDQILQMYLNEIPYGSNTYGVQAASQFYFGKDVSQINLAEAAVLAALPQAPSRYSPYGPNKDLLIGRQQYILDQMVKQNYISEAEAEKAKQTEIKFQERLENITAPHFVMYVKQLLEEKYGAKEVEQGGLKIITTLDLTKQKIAETALQEQAVKNEKNYNAKNAALVALDPKTGEVLAMVGSRDYFNDAIDGQVNVALRPRQPGSSLKPVVYAAAFIKGFTPDTKVYDVVTNFSTDPSKKYEPHNYDSNEHGPVSFRQALAGSLNIPAVKAIYLAGINNVIKLAQELGYSTLNDKDRFGLSLVLGGGEVKLLEHARAYGVFATEGELADTVLIKKVGDRSGNVLEEFKEPTRKKVLDANITRLISSILSDNNARAFIFGVSNYLTLSDRPVAAKTGTTNDYRDAWTIGYTPSLVAGVWVGNNDNSEMKRGADGSQIAAPIWNRFMREALVGTAAENFNGYTLDPKTPPILLGQGFGESKIKIDRASGLLATDQTPANFIEEKSFFNPHSLLYYVNKNDPLGGPPKNPAVDPQFNIWENAIQDWIRRRQEKDPSFATSQPPIDSDNLHRTEFRPTFQVSGLADGQTITSGLPASSLQGLGGRPLDHAEYLINGQIFAAVYLPPFTLNRSLAILPNGDYQLTIRGCDQIDNCGEQTFNVLIKINGGASNDFSVAWLTPAKDATIAAKNLPLTLKVKLTNYDAVAAVKFIYQGTDGQAQLIQEKKLIRSEEIFLAWPATGLSEGDYQLWAEAVNWSGQTQATNKLKIVLKLK